MYPRPGTANAKTVLKLVEFPADVCLTKTPSPSVKISCLKGGLDAMFPWSEYPVRVGWIPGCDKCWVQMLSRSQQRLSLAEFSISEFLHDPNGAGAAGAAGAAEYTTLVEENTPLYITMTDILTFLPSDGTGTLRFIWATEITGFRHLQVVSKLDGQPAVRSALTTGDDWEVKQGSLGYSPAKRVIFFAASKETPLETHWYSQSLDHSYSCVGEATLLTEKGYTHNVKISQSGRFMVDNQSSTEVPPRCVLRDLTTASEVAVLYNGPNMDGYKPPDKFSFTSKNGFDLHGCIYRASPPRATPTAKLPTIVYVYGGPGVQLVRNAYAGTSRGLLFSFLARCGFNVVTIDGRGSAGRGALFEGAIKNRVGTIEVDDQVEGLEYLIAQGTYNIDPERIGVHGHSYGGYMSLLCIGRRPDVFKVVVSGAPVTCWEVYDTGYTERYIGTPQEFPAVYDTGSVCKLAPEFPDETNRVLICHGLIDENVHFTNTALFVEELAKHGKPYSLQVYPSDRHGIRSPHGKRHYRCAMLNFFLSNL